MLTHPLPYAACSSCLQGDLRGTATIVLDTRRRRSEQHVAPPLVAPAFSLGRKVQALPHQTRRGRVGDQRRLAWRLPYCTAQSWEIFDYFNISSEAHFKFRRWVSESHCCAARCWGLGMRLDVFTRYQVVFGHFVNSSSKPYYAQRNPAKINNNELR